MKEKLTHERNKWRWKIFFTSFNMKLDMIVAVLKTTYVFLYLDCKNDKVNTDY